jgi:hypothetical protein
MVRTTAPPKNGGSFGQSVGQLWLMLHFYVLDVVNVEF